ncbi:Y-family DNA polymerase [Sphingobacterium bovisgrunnientis]|uniref:Y-family DNA polymerase n=1 Tax=Sphingobacterium bovisgrunnientis TaxID=1874697 RepID=UPI00135693EF|nr:Y-family DNA polymerase [Sphingobacterium bovisgrunnientis]
MYALIDCNNFYASCERVFRPDLIGLPIVVLSNNDGCVIARSNEAKDCGIPMGAPAFQYTELFKKHNVQVFSANFALYGDMSNRVMQTLSNYCIDQEIFSIDECFMKLDGYDFLELKEYGIKMRQEVFDNTGIQVSVGIAPTKSLSKVANRIAKKYPELSKGCHVMRTTNQIEKALKWLDIEDVWGIGRQHAKRLFKLGVDNAYDFTKLSDQWVQKNLSIVGLRLKRDLSGIPTLDLEEVENKKNIASTRSFDLNYTKFEDVQERVSTFATSCSEKLRRQKSFCSSITVFVMTNRFRTEQDQYQNSITLDLPFATNSAIELSKYATVALKRIFREGYAYKKAGVIVSNFSPDDIEQITLFDNRDKRHDALMKVLDVMNRQYGQHTIRLGCQGKKKWTMRQEMLSPCYTTKLKDIITIKV